MPNTLRETDHDYQNCLVGNFYNNAHSGTFASWDEFKQEFYAFPMDGGITPYDDTYHFVFRYDIHKRDLSRDEYELELCIMLQRKGIYSHLTVKGIPKDLLNGEVKQWLIDRSTYMKNLWKEVL